MKTLAYIYSLVIALLVTMNYALTQPQLQEWEDTISVASLTTSRILCAYSDGYGQHILANQPIEGELDVFGYYLLGNNGQVIPGHTWLSPNIGNYFAMSVTGYGEIVSIAVKNGINQEIRLDESTDGGKNWATTATYIPELWVTVGSLDAFADDRGVHIIWQNENQDSVYYVQYRRDGNQFVNFKNMREGTTYPDEVDIRLYRPKVVASSNKVIVGFIQHSANPDIPATRDYNILTEQWDGSYRYASLQQPPPPPPPTPPSARQVNLAQLGNYVHILTRTGVFGEVFGLWSSARELNGNWGTASLRVTGSNTEEDYRRNATVIDDSLYVAHYGTPGLTFLAYNEVSGWISPFNVDAGLWTNVTISSSKTGVYVFYHFPSGSSVPKMRRRVEPIYGDIVQSGYWTGNNWITGRGGNYRVNLVGSSPTSTITVTMKENTASVTTLVPNGDVHVGSWATLINETGAQFFLESNSQVIVESNGIYKAAGGSHIFESGAKIATNGGTIHVADNVTLTIPSGVTLASYTAGTFVLGQNAKIIIESGATLDWSANSNWQFGQGAEVVIYGKVSVANDVDFAIPVSGNFTIQPGGSLRDGREIVDNR